MKPKRIYQFTVHSPANGLFFRQVSEVLSFAGSPSQWMEGLYDELGKSGKKRERTRSPSYAECCGGREVDDELAYRFSVSFYEFLREGKTLAEAAQLSRLAISEAPSSTWLAYTLYGDPMATVDFRLHDCDL